MKNGLAKTNCLFLICSLLLLGVFLSWTGIKPKPALAATGINKTVSFQGRLFNAQGAVVPDGFYNIQFKIYQDGDGQTAGDTTGSPAGSLKWTENWLNSAGHGVKVVNGFLSVQLGTVNPFGSNVDWNQDTLWLSMQIGDTSSCTITTTFQSNCSGDGEMTPMQPMTAAPYALNAGELGGLTSSNFVQLAQGLQTDSSNVTSIAINKTGSGKILDLQNNGTDVLTVDTSANTINVGVTGAVNANSTVHIADSSAGVQTVSIGSSNSTSTTTIKSGTGGIIINPNGTSNTGVTIQPLNNSTAAFQIQDQAGTGNLLIADTTVNRIGIGKAPSSGYQLDVAGSVGTQTRFVINSSATTGGTLTKKTTVGAGGVTANDVVVLNSSSLAVDTTTARDIRVYGVSLTTTSNGAVAEIALDGNITVNADTAAIAIGDQLVTSATSGRVTVDNGATTGILGVALTSKAGGSNGTVDVSLGQVRGAYNPIFKTNSDNTTAFQVQNSVNSFSVFTVDTSGNQVVLGKASSLTGKLAFATAGGGTLTINPTSSASSFTITLPAETGTVCTTAASGTCNTAGGLSNVAYLNQDQAFSGKNTFNRSGSGANDYSLGVTGTPAASSTSSLLRLGNAITAGNGVANGGTYLSIVEPSSGAGSAADFFNFQNGSTVEMQLTAGGNLTVAGTYDTNTFNSNTLGFGGNSAVTINSSGSNNITLDTGSSGGTVALANNAATTNISTSNAAHTIGIGTGGGGTTTQAVTIGAATNSSSTLTLQGGNGSTAILLQTGNNGSGAAGGIQIGNTSGANSQTVAVGTNNSGTNIVNIGTGTSQDSVTIGDTTNANSSVAIKAGSTGGISLGANTTLSANSNFTYASGTGKFDAHNATGTFDTSTGNNSLNGATTVTGTNTFTVNGGATTLNGAAAGSGTAAKINTNAASNVGLVVQGASSQTAALLQVQDSTGSAMFGIAANGDVESTGVINTPYGGFGSYGNLIVQSEQLGTTWSATGIAVTQNDGASNPAPDGSTTADKLVSSASGAHTLTQTYSSAGNNTYTFSIWLKTATPPQPVQLRIDSNGTPASGTAASYTLTGGWQRYSVTQTFTSGVTSITPTLVITNNNTSVVGWGAQLIQGSSAGVYIQAAASTVAQSTGLISNGSSIFQNSSDSATAYQFQNSSGVDVATVDTSGGQLVVGAAGSLSGKIALATTGGGTITLSPTSSASSFTITIPAETGTICTTAASAACTAVYAPAGGGYVNFAPSSVQTDASNNNTVFLNKNSGTGNILELQKSSADVFKVDNSGNVTSTGQNTLTRNSTGGSDFTFGVTGTTSATGNSSLVRIGAALTGGNGVANGGTYLSIVEPSSGAGSAADFLNLQNGTTVELQLTSGGNLTVGGTYNGNTFDNAGHLTFGNAGAATISTTGANNLTVDTGGSAATLALGNTAATTNIGTSNAAHTIGIGTGGGGTTTQAVTIGAATNSSSTLALQGGNGGSAISLLTGNNGAGTAGGIQIGNTNGANSQTIAIGTNATASATNIVQIGTAATAQDSVTIGSTSNASSAVAINAGSTGGITLTSSTTNINSATVANNQSTVAFFNSPTNVTAFQAGTSISIGATTGTITLRNANQTFGNAAGTGVFTNNGATFNSTLVVSDDSDGGTLGGTPSGGLTAAQSVDVYTSISVGQTTAGQTISLPTPTASTNYGRILYISNIGTTSFILSGIRIPQNSTATLVWSNTNGGASWQFAGAGGASIENQNAADQTADFRINGTGRANTSFTSPVFDSISGALGIGSVNATTINIGNSGTTPTTAINILTKGAGTTVKTATDVTNAFQVQNNSGANILQVDSLNRDIKVFENGGTTHYARIFYDTATSTANYTADTGTVAVGRGAGAISVTAGATSAISITAAASSTWKTTAGTLTLQSGTGTSDFLILNAGGSNQVQVNGSAVVKLGSAASDPTCTTAAIYYNTTSNLFRGCQNGTWATLSSTTQTLQQGYNQSTGGTTPEIKVDSTRTGVDIQDADTSIGGVLFGVRMTNAGGLGTSLFNVSTANNSVNVGSSSSHSTNPVILVLDDYANSGADPTGVTGAMYYNGTKNKFRCYENGAWVDCISGPSSTASSLPNSWGANSQTGKTAAGTILIVPIYISGQITVNDIRVQVTTALGATGDVGLYDSSGNLVINGGSGTLATTTGLKTITPTQSGTARILEAGQYYAAVTWNSTTGSVGGLAVTSGQIKRLGTIAGGGSVLPSSITISSIADSTALFGVSFNN